MLVFKAGPRPTTADLNCLAVLKHALAECRLDNLCIVFTFCDEINPNKRPKPGKRIFDLDYAHEFYEALLMGSQGKIIEGMPEINKNRIFFFRGEDLYQP